MTTSFFNKIHDKKTSKINNPFEKVMDMRGPVVKQTVPEIGDTFTLSELMPDEAQKERNNGNNNFSDLNVQKLQTAYKNKDEEEIARLQKILYPEETKKQEDEALASSYLKRLKNEEEEYYIRKKQEEEEKKRQEAQEEEDKKRREAEQRASSQQAEIPMGKVRKNILGGGKKPANTQLTPELKPNAGKP